MKTWIMIVTMAAVLGGTVFARAGAGNCLEFNGTNGYALAAGLSSALTNITVEAWVKHRSLGDAVQRYVTVGDEVAVLRHNVGGGQADGLHFYIKTDGTLKHLATGSALPTGEWHHVAGTWDGTTMSLYLNGALQTNSTPGGTLSAPSGSVELSSAGDTLDGQLDEVRIWWFARSEAEIRADMARGMTGAESGLAACYPLNQQATSVLEDATTNHVDGALYGDTAWVTSSAPVNILMLETNAVLPNVGFHNGIRNSGAAWGDFDGDGLLDIVISGYTNWYVKFTGLLRNEGGGAFTNINDTVDGVRDTTLKWTDIDNDNDLDLIIGGRTENYDIATLAYRNDISDGGGFMLIQSNLPFVEWGDIDTADFDQDGDLDLILAHQTHDASRPMEIWLNEPGGFTNINAALPALEGFYPRMAVADYDGDGYPDFASIDDTGVWVFKNDLSESGTFIPMQIITCDWDINGGLAWGDFDNDGDLDLAVAMNGFEGIFRNDVNQGGGFTNIFTSAMTDRSYQSVAWGDVDNDGDLDLLVIGPQSASLYRNDGNGIFTEIRLDLGACAMGDIGWGDYDRDGDLDLLAVSGRWNDPTAVYRNESTVSNTPPTAPPLVLVEVDSSNAPFGALRWAAATDAQTPASGLGYNVWLEQLGGEMIVSPMANTNTGLRLLPGLGNCYSRRWMGLNQMLATGVSYRASVQAIDTAWAGGAWSDPLEFSYAEPPTMADCELLRHSAHTMTLSSSVSGGVYETSGLIWGTNDNLSFSGDYLGEWASESGGAFELVLTNLTADTTYTVRSFARNANVVYYGDSATYTTAVSRWQAIAVLPPHGYSDYQRLAAADFDNDGDLDLAVSSEGYTWIFRNDDMVFTEVARLDNSGMSGMDWGDVDGDGYLDLLLGGSGIGSDYVPSVYRNDTATGGGFHRLFTVSYDDDPFPTNDRGAVALVDVDSDGDLDFMFCGQGTTVEYDTRLYLNDGDGNFTLFETEIEPMNQGRIAWGDYDNDGDMDLAFAGYTPSGYVTRIYRNDLSDGGGFVNIFSPQTDNFNHYFLPMTWGDYDGDGDLDLLQIVYSAASGKRELRIFRNDGADTFTQVSPAGLLALFDNAGWPTAAWGDSDNDGTLDLLFYRGRSAPEGPEVYLNDGAGAFTKESFEMSETFSKEGEGIWGDFDGDGALDAAFIMGGGVTIFRNVPDVYVANTPPAAPPALHAENTTTNFAVLSWAAATDAETPSATLTYNLRVGTSPGANDILSGMADPVSGQRRLARMGNVQLNTNWTLRGLSDGLYYWSVQAVDNGFAGGSWASEDSFYFFIDTDGDGIADAWETLHFGGPTNANAAAMASNTVNTVLETFLADLDPHDPEALFAITTISNDSPMTVFFDSSSNRLYSLLWSTNLVEGIWTPAESRMGIGGVDSMEGTNAPARAIFYRLRSELP